jgi:hypothetical protein
VFFQKRDETNKALANAECTGGFHFGNSPTEPVSLVGHGGVDRSEVF